RTEHDATASHDEIARLLNRWGFLRTAAVGAAGGSPPRAPADALDTARVGYDFLRTVRFLTRRRRRGRAGRPPSVAPCRCRAGAARGGGRRSAPAGEVSRRVSRPVSRRVSLRVSRRVSRRRRRGR
ncbi:MAG TPA: hypothetical protein VE547_22565, partial [Mycobacteriales bacterium]|nr:hypothetical protein [Mycobacteriales bacterium]